MLGYSGSSLSRCRAGCSRFGVPVPILCCVQPAVCRESSKSGMQEISVSELLQDERRTLRQGGFEFKARGSKPLLLASANKMLRLIKCPNPGGRFKQDALGLEARGLRAWEGGWLCSSRPAAFRGPGPALHPGWGSQPAKAELRPENSPWVCSILV